MKFDRNAAQLATRLLYVTGILLSLATFILHALPVNWGIFLSSACFIIGSFLWGAVRGASRDQQPGN